jgi:hypothetical protein
MWYHISVYLLLAYCASVCSAQAGEIQLSTNETKILLVKSCSGDVTMTLDVNATIAVDIITSSTVSTIPQLSFKRITKLNEIITTSLPDDYYLISVLAHSNCTANININLSCNDDPSLSTSSIVAIAFGTVAILIAMYCILRHLCKMKRGLPRIP